MSVEDLSSEELRELQKKIEHQLKALQRSEREAAIEEIYGIAHRLGVMLNDIIEKLAGFQPNSKVAVQFSNPSNAMEEWTGRGRQPKWIKEALAAGVSMDTLRVLRNMAQ